MSTCPVIRQALPEERSGVVATVAAAFAEDPGWAFILGKEYEHLAADFVGALFDVRVASQKVGLQARVTLPPSWRRAWP